ncbi:hypothetical protein [Nonlabens sp.]|uniref:hypothetical protein n=1 Tax=Nonlabens sp. TaxID=1888209 RepID=UPI003F699DDC
MKRYSLVLFLLFAFAKADFSKAQQVQTVKMEQEERVNASDFPKSAVQLLSQITKTDQQIKYYKETDGYLTSYEAKYKRRGRRYSAEFNELGLLIDIEKDIKKKEIKKVAFELIKKELHKIAQQYKIEKVQEQYLINEQNPSSITLQIDNNEFDNYELIVAFKENRKIYRKEMLYSKEGILIRQRNVKRLEYDFILF